MITGMTTTSVIPWMADAVLAMAEKVDVYEMEVMVTSEVASTDAKLVRVGEDEVVDG
jgi:hypothetical protein